jgi:hypothetical protein
MLPYLLYLLQPLDIGYFSPLKRAYSAEVNALIYIYIYYVNKQSFLLAFKVAFKYIFLESNIKASFKGARLILFNLEVIILKLNIKLRTPLLPIIEYNP